MVRSRWKWVLLGVVLLLVAAELLLSALKPPVALVRVINRGEYPITDLVVSTGSSRVSVARIAPDQMEVAMLGGGGKSPLVLRFTQFNNPMTDFEIADFEPRRLQRERSMLVLELRNNEIVRYQEPDDTPGRWERLGNWLRDSLVEAKVPEASP